MTTIDLDSLYLDSGDHSGPDEGLCLMEAVAYVAGEPHSDHPACVSPVLGAFGRELNDRLDDDRRQKLKPLIPLLPGTAGDGLDEWRGYRALDWLVRTNLPAWLDLAGLTAEAAELRALRRIADLAAAEAAGPVVRAAWGKAREKRVAAAAAAAWAVAGAVAGAAAKDAAGDAAGDAAKVAVGVAAGDAAKVAVGVAAGDAAVGDAAWAAARAAAGDAAWAAAKVAAGDAAGDAAKVAVGVATWAAMDALRPTVEQLQDSAIDLFRQMIDPRSLNAA